MSIEHFSWLSATTEPLFSASDRICSLFGDKGMAMKEGEIALVNAHINQIDQYGNFYHPIMELAGPKGPALQSLVDLLLARGIRRRWFAMIAVHYHLEPGLDPASRPWCTSGACPVHGYLAFERASNTEIEILFPEEQLPASLDPIVECAIALANLSPEVLLRLALAEVFPAHIATIRSIWIAYATEQDFPGVDRTDIEAAAKTVMLSIGLGKIASLIKTDCKGSSCPGVPRTVVKS